ncbi:MAG: radical SAM protein, partial [Defluviitaleaceae bacterium]|nr:radical SAM protein [Defluviitaleaceae bacterium]
DCAPLLAEAGLKTVLVTNGFINREPLAELLPHIDALNIDLKGFTSGFYESLGGNLQTVKDSIALARAHSHVEVTTLVIPNENDSPYEIEALALFISKIDPDIPLHLSRFFPRHRSAAAHETPRETILLLKKTAEKHLRRVYTGNMH